MESKTTSPNKQLARLKANLKDGLEKFIEHDIIQKIRQYLPELNFITVHYSYFILTCLLTSIIFYLSSNPWKSISYADSLFLVVSAMTEAGLNTVNLSQMTTAQQIILWFLIIMGSSIFVSISTVLTRKRVFETRFRDLVKMQKEARRTRRRSMSMTSDRNVGSKKFEKANGLDFASRYESRGFEPRDPISGRPPAPPSDLPPAPALDPQMAAGSPRPRSGLGVKLDVSSSSHSTDAVNDLGMTPDPDHISFMRYVPSAPASPKKGRPRVLSFVGVGAHPRSSGYQSPFPFPKDGIYSRGRRKEELSSEEDQLNHAEYPNYLTRHTTGRNGQFFGLTKPEREHLGGVEYRAITLLAYVVPIYFILWQLLGCIGLGAYMAHNKADVSRSNGINPWWLGIFNGVSAFNNSGMSLLDANMIPFQTSIYTLMTMGLLILAGNTAYPLFLRLIIWSMLKILCLMYPSDDQYTDHKATLRFILNYPRRVYTNLFPSTATWWLLFMVTFLNGVDWASFEVLNIGNKAVDSIPSKYRVLDGLFQALAVRSGGFYIIAIPSLRIGLQVLYMIMMYISVYPVTVTMRHSNVYEERSLGIYADEPTPSADLETGPKFGTLAGRLKRTITTTFSHPFPNTPAVGNLGTGKQFVRQQVRGQLAHDIWWLVGAILFISCIEVSNFDRDPITYSVFNIAFEVVSGYGCVGISTGLPNEAYSFSGGWHVSSKLILIAVMLRGRHRGLPVALDRAVRLPNASGEGMRGLMEEEDAGRRRSMSMSSRVDRKFDLGILSHGTTPRARVASPRV